jgi:hypothetical protein
MNRRKAIGGVGRGQDGKKTRSDPLQPPVRWEVLKIPLTSPNRWDAVRHRKIKELPTK